MLDFITLLPEVNRKGSPVPPEMIDYAPAVSRPSKIVCVGLNYLDHIKESHGKRPDRPILFSKFSTSLIGHNKEIIWDSAITKKVDFEAELAVIMGSVTRNSPAKDVMQNIFGYTCANDVSARDLQFGDGQWVRGKSLDTFCPLAVDRDN
jgi:5-carboxymethyl-2-hydroxymuconate isomerase